MCKAEHLDTPTSPETTSWLEQKRIGRRSIVIGQLEPELNSFPIPRWSQRYRLLYSTMDITRIVSECVAGSPREQSPLVANLFFVQKGMIAGYGLFLLLYGALWVSQPYLQRQHWNNGLLLILIEDIYLKDGYMSVCLRRYVILGILMTGLNFCGLWKVGRK